VPERLEVHPHRLSAEPAGTSFSSSSRIAVRFITLTSLLAGPGCFPGSWHAGRS
jgi:hypothetical protein